MPSGLIHNQQTMWEYTPSIELIRKIMDDRMFPLTLSGLEQGIQALKQKS